MAKQREFPWMQSVRRPENADSKLLAQCDSEAMAVLISIRIGCRHSDAWAARRLGMHKSYLSMIMSGKRNVPKWLPVPLAYLTGTWLLSQYRRLQDALASAEIETKRDRGERLAREFLRGAA